MFLLFLCPLTPNHIDGAHEPTQSLCVCVSHSEISCLLLKSHDSFAWSRKTFVFSGCDEHLKTHITVTLGGVIFIIMHEEQLNCLRGFMFTLLILSLPSLPSSSRLSQGWWARCCCSTNSSLRCRENRLLSICPQTARRRPERRRPAFFPRTCFCRLLLRKRSIIHALWRREAHVQVKHKINSLTCSKSR